MTWVGAETIVAFDVDETLTVRDCVFPFMSLVAGRFFLLRIALSSPMQVISLLKRRDRDGLKKLFIGEVFTGREAVEINELGEKFARVVLRKWIREDVAQRLRWHQQSGHTVLLVSASLNSYLVPFAKAIDVHAVLCTTLEVDDNERLTGVIVGNNCRGPEKVIRLQQWARDQGITGDGWLSVGYGDSRGDADMLAFAQVGCNVSQQILEPAC